MTDKMFQARKRYEEIRDEKLFGTKSPYIYSLQYIPVMFLGGREDGVFRYVNNLTCDVRIQEFEDIHRKSLYSDGDGMLSMCCKVLTYKLESIAFKGYGRVFRFDVYTYGIFDLEKAKRKFQKFLFPIHMSSGMRLHNLVK